MPAAATMTAEEFLALPDDGSVERWLVDGGLRERAAVPYRNRFHCEAMALTATRLTTWAEARPEPRGRVYAGDLGVRLPGEPTTLFGLDIACFAADAVARTPANSTVIHGVPTLAVEILSPNDRQEDIKEKLAKLLAAGTPLVWIFDTYDRTVLAYQPGAEPRFFNASQELAAEPILPGFRAPVAKLFG